jgi:hypothetical protein
MNAQVGSATEGKLGSNVLREPEINKSTETIKRSKGFLSRRSFLGKSLAVGAGTIGAGLLANAPTARASGGLTAGDKAMCIHSFLSASLNAMMHSNCQSSREYEYRLNENLRGSERN